MRHSATNTFFPSYIYRLKQQKRIVIQDSKALAHMVKNGYDYPKNNIVRGELGRTLGHGLLYVEGKYISYLHIYVMLRDDVQGRTTNGNAGC